jgi:multisubunit Na+/H+ antiporter MnhC subunit
MDAVRPIYKKLLIAAVVIYVAGTALLLSDLCRKVGALELEMMHVTGKCAAKH